MAIKPRKNDPEEPKTSGFVQVVLLSAYMRHKVGTLITVTPHEAKTLVAQGKAEYPQIEFKG